MTLFPLNTFSTVQKLLEQKKSLYAKKKRENDKKNSKNVISVLHYMRSPSKNYFNLDNDAVYKLNLIS